MTATVNSKPYGIIYCITNKVNGKRYIVQTTRNIEERLAAHFCSNGRHGCRLLGAAVAKYGRESFEVTQLASAETQSDLDAVEIALIRQYGTTNRDAGYNIALGGSGGKQSAETIALRVAKTAGQKRTDEFRMRVSEQRKGTKHSEEAKAKISLAAINRKPPSEETREKLAAAGAKSIWTDERRAKAAAAASGKTHSEATKKKLSEIFSGHKQSAETVAKRVAANTGRVRSEETRKKISEVRKAYWAAKR